MTTEPQTQRPDTASLAVSSDIRAARVCHLSTVHSAFDVRIFLKECRSLAEAGYDTHLVVTHPSDLHKEGVHIHGLPRSRGRLSRILLSSARCLRKAREIDAKLYHFHDPELISVGLALKRSGKSVVYDVHESHAESMLDRTYIPAPLRRLVSNRVARAEARADASLDAIVAATPKIARQFTNKRTVLVQNYPMLGELSSPAPIPFKDRAASFCFVGGISAVRGAREMVEAIAELPMARLVLVGEFTPRELKNALSLQPGWGQVDGVGQKNRAEVAEVMGRCLAGLVPFHPLRNHVESQPNKLFEYMAAGLPVIGSDFPHWRAIVDKEACGLLVDPLEPQAIARAMERILSDRQGAEEMGARGAKAVQEKYNWTTQERALLDLYASLLTL